MEQTRAPSSRATVRQFPERGIYDAATIRSILANGLVCHVGLIDGGHPLVVPTAYGIYGDDLVIHGLPASRLLVRLRSSVPVCLNVTLVDGLVLARSAFEHSMNYRSVTIFGTGRWIRDRPTKRAALRAISDRMLPGRWADVRPPTIAELNQTHVLAVPLSEASAKVRSGPPSPDDDPWTTWTGVLPAEIRWRHARAHETDLAVPSYLRLVEGRAVGTLPGTSASERGKP